MQTLACRRGNGGEGPDNRPLRFVANGRFPGVRSHPDPPLGRVLSPTQWTCDEPVLPRKRPRLAGISASSPGICARRLKPLRNPRTRRTPLRTSGSSWTRSIALFSRMPPVRPRPAPSTVLRNGEPRYGFSSTSRIVWRAPPGRMRLWPANWEKPTPECYAVKGDAAIPCL